VSNLLVAEHSPLKYQKRIVRPALTTAFATLFIRDGTEVLFYDGMVLEPQIYWIGVDFLHGRSTTAAAAYGLREQQLRLR
jgi:hypothetical protein